MSFRNMIYNSQKEHLEIPEYGRNLQDLINNARTIEDKEERQKYVERILGLMLQMYPQNKSIEDAKSKMWKHLYRIANYDLDIVPPEGVDLTREAYKKKPQAVDYPQKHPRFKHYGNNVKSLIQKAIAMEDEAKKQAFVVIICNYMKLAYRTWNREHYVGDELILNDLATLSQGKLTVDDGANLDSLTNSNKSKRHPRSIDTMQDRRKGGRRNNDRRRNNNNDRRRKK